MAQAAPVRNRNGVVTRWFGPNTDITEQKEREERHNHLMREVDHRAMNALAVAQAAVTRPSAPNLDEDRKRSEEQTDELPSPMRTSHAGYDSTKKNKTKKPNS